MTTLFFSTEENKTINGISENMYNLHINYSCNAQLNGYMFVGNCSHSEIEDAILPI